MYDIALHAHSWLRWLVLIAGIYAVVRGFAGRSGRRIWTRTDERIGAIFTGLLDLQVLLGLLLYFALSPVTRAAMADFGAAMGNSGLRYWAVEHPFGVIAGVVLAHVGRARIRKTTDDQRKHGAAALFFTLALIAILVSIPWPGMPQGRPLFRM
jgi:hypothetical protein